jgi:hypothetical protein
LPRSQTEENGECIAVSAAQLKNNQYSNTQYKELYTSTFDSSKSLMPQMVKTVELPSQTSKVRLTGKRTTIGFSDKLKI